MQTPKESALSSDEEAKSDSSSCEELPRVPVQIPGLDQLKSAQESTLGSKPQTAIEALARNVYRMGLKKLKDSGYKSIKLIEILASSSSSEDETFNIRSELYKRTIIRHSEQPKNRKSTSKRPPAPISHSRAIRKLKFNGLGKRLVLTKMHRLEEFIYPQFSKDEDEDLLYDIDEECDEHNLRKFFLGTPRAFDEYEGEMIDSCIEYLPKELFHIEQVRYI
jgi:hypothetical protein